MEVDPIDLGRSPDTLGPYLPAVVRSRRIGAGPPQRVAYRYQAAVLFADISGFTGLAEQLASRPGGGAEEISRVLNAYFGRIADLVVAGGGDLLRLAGDAAVAMWHAADGHAQMPDLVASAASCGLAIRDALQDQELHGSRISVRVAIACGDVVEVHVGGVDGHWEFLVGGEPLTAVSAALHRAAPGEVVVAAGSWDLIRERAAGVVDREGSAKISAVSALEQGPLDEIVVDDVWLRAYLPAAVLSRHDAGQTGWLADLRQLSVVFVRLGGIDYVRSDALERIDQTLRALQVPLYRYEGQIRQFLVDDKGTILIVAFGLPPVSHEDDAVRAVRTALDMHEAAAEVGIRTAIGIASGRVFCGPIGSAARREYGLVGDVVNVAARLMEAAPDDVLCDAETQQRARHRIPFERLPAFELKGRGRSIALFRPSAGPERSGIQQMIGRASERAVIMDAVERARMGTGGVILIEGEPGVGKTRLLADTLGSVSGVQILRGRADPLERARPYHVWTPVLDAILGVADGASSPAIRSLVDDPELGRYAALLNSVATVDLAESDLTREMAGETRANSTNDLIVELLRRRAAAAPLVVVIEDAHWADSASWVVLAALARDVPAAVTLVTSRPMPDAPRERTELIAHGARRIALDTLSQAETLVLVRQRLGVSEVALDVVRRIHRRSAGNPLFVEELTAALRDGGLVTVAGGVCGFAANVDPDRLELPSTVQGIITTRIDQLGVPEQLTLKVAAVIGLAFSSRVLQDVHPIAQDRSKLSEHLDKLRRLDLVVPGSSASADLAFKHEITREVAYGLLTREQRVQLHRAVAGSYEREHANDLAPLFPLLAHHWREAGDRERTAAYLERAGEQALRNGAYREAVAFLEEALAPPSPGEGRPERPALDAGRLERMLGESYLGLGRHSDGHEHLRRAVALLGVAEPATLPRLAPRILRQVARQIAHRLARSGIGLAHGAERDRLLEAARAYIRLVEVHWFANRTPFLVHAGLASLNLAERIGPSPELARAYAIMTLAAGSIPQRYLAEMYAGRSVATARDVGQVHALAYSLFITSVYAIGTAQWARIEAALAEATKLFEEVGDRRLLGDARTVQAMSLLYRGAFAASEPIFDAVRASGLRGENVQHVIWGGIGSAESLYRRGRIDEAIDQLHAVLRDLERSPDRAEELRAQGLLALALDDRGETELADLAASRAAALIAGLAAPTAHYLLEGYAAVAELRLRRAASGGGASAREDAERACAAMRRFARLFPIGTPRSLLLTGRASWLRGDRAGAFRRWTEGLVQAERSGMRYDQARLHLELASHVQDAARRSEHLAFAIAIFRELGAVPDLARGEAQISGATS
jgi:class 3 adenylate cyclase/tetratricopeptide (TPR) repeat protein